MPKGIYDHSFLKGKKRSMTTRLKMNKSHLGKKHTEETKKKLKKALKGKHNSPDTEFKKGIHNSPKTEFQKEHLPWLKGKKWSKEMRKKIIMKLKGQKRSAKFKEKVSKNNVRYWKGKKGSEEAKIKLGLSKIGERNPAWKGGITLKPYSIDWTETLRESIRQRDRYICRLCGQRQSDRALSVHHIDGDKNNSNSFNLISLCVYCHKLVHIQNETFWKNYLKNLIK